MNDDPRLTKEPSYGRILAEHKKLSKKLQRLQTDRANRGHARREAEAKWMRERDDALENDLPIPERPTTPEPTEWDQDISDLNRRLAYLNEEHLRWMRGDAAERIATGIRKQETAVLEEIRAAVRQVEPLVDQLAALANFAAEVNVGTRGQITVERVVAAALTGRPILDPPLRAAAPVPIDTTPDALDAAAFEPVPPSERRATVSPLYQNVGRQMFRTR